MFFFFLCLLVEMVLPRPSAAPSRCEITRSPRATSRLPCVAIWRNSEVWHIAVRFQVHMVLSKNCAPSATRRGFCFHARLRVCTLPNTPATVPHWAGPVALQCRPCSGVAIVPTAAWCMLQSWGGLGCLRNESLHAGIGNATITTWSPEISAAHRAWCQFANSYALC